MDSMALRAEPDAQLILRSTQCQLQESCPGDRYGWSSGGDAGRGGEAMGGQEGQSRQKRGIGAELWRLTGGWRRHTRESR